VTRVVNIEPAVDAFDVDAVRAAVKRAAEDLKSRGLEPVANFMGVLGFSIVTGYYSEC
jgi:hypothetical protein